MTSRTEQEVGNIFLLNPDKKNKLNVWFLRRDRRVWIDAVLGCRNVPVDDPKRTLELVSKPVALGYTTVEDPPQGNLK